MMKKAESIMVETKKGLYIISTPIGNLEDITFRALNILKNSDIIVCENPKHSIKLLNKFGIKKKLFSLHDYNEINTIKKLEKHSNSSVIALISDAGSPLISDPGFKLVNHFINKKIYVTSIPGPSSVIASIQLSGLENNNFLFYGFVPKKNNLIDSLIEKFITSDQTGIFFISGNRLLSFLEKLSNVSKNINIAVCKELTKLNENVVRDKIDKIIEKIIKKELNIKGEFTIVARNIKGLEKRVFNLDTEKQINKLLEKYSLTEVVKIVHKLTNISKNKIYAETLRIKND